MADTAKIILLKGDRNKPESAEHIIKFPGGSISVCRTSNNEYWAHIEVHKGVVIDEAVRESATGKIVAARIDYDPGSGHQSVEEIKDFDQVHHVAVRIAIA